MSFEGPDHDRDDSSPEDDDDELLGFDRLLPPEDRLWRHPSELAGLAASAAPITTPRRRTSRTSVVLATCTAIIAITLGGLLALALIDPPADKRQELNASAVRSGQVGPTTTVSASFTPVSPTVATPAVARVRAVAGGHTTSGSAVVLGPAGHLITSARLVTDASQITVTLKDGRSLAATLVGVDSLTGLAVLRVAVTNLHPASLVRDLPRRGEIALTIGGPPTANSSASSAGTRGVIVAVGAPLHTLAGTLDDMIETSRAPRVGEEGGALVNQEGALIGITISTAAVLRSGSPTAAGWAVPIDVAARVVHDIATTGTAHHAWLGLSAIESGDGDDGSVSFAVVTQVTEVDTDSPAARAGLRPGDEVAMIDDHPTLDPASLVSVLRRYQPGDRVVITFVRDGKRLATTAILGDRTG